MNPKVDFYFHKNEKWKTEIEELRHIILECKLNEELKWGSPCYTLDRNNIVLIHVFKDYCALLFFKGAILKDDKKLLVQQTKNVQAARQLRFTSLQEITKRKTAIKALIKEAIAVEKTGTKVVLKKTDEFEMPEEFKTALDKNAKLKSAFYALTPGRQRAYLLFFAGAKQSATRMARIKKYEQHILKGKGLNDLQ